MAAATVRGEANKRPNWQARGRNHAVRQHGIGGLGNVTESASYPEFVEFHARFYRGGATEPTSAEVFRNMQLAFDWVDEKFAETAERGRRA